MVREVVANTCIVFAGVADAWIPDCAVSVTDASVFESESLVVHGVESESLVVHGVGGEGLGVICSGHGVLLDSSSSSDESVYIICCYIRCSVSFKGVTILLLEVGPDNLGGIDFLALFNRRDSRQ